MKYRFYKKQNKWNTKLLYTDICETKQLHLMKLISILSSLEFTTTSRTISPKEIM